MASHPLFSIILPTYNRGHLLGKAVESVLQQEFKDFELIIMDDGSGDNTKSVISSFSDARIKYYYQQNQERSRARNNAIGLSKGDYICFLDSDDKYLPTHLLVLQRFIVENRKPVCMIFTGGMVFHSETGKRTELNSPEFNPKDPLNYFLTHSVIPDRVCLHREITDSFRFNPDVRIGEDTLLWAEICTQYPVHRLPDLTIEYQVHDENTVSLKNNVFLDRLNGLRQLFTKPEIAKLLNPNTRKHVFSVCHYGIARHHLLYHRWLKAFRHILLSVFYEPRSPQTKAKLFELILYFKNKKP